MLFEHSLRRGKQKIQKPVCHQIFEYVFGLSPDEAITAQWHAPGVFQGHLNSHNVARGRLGRDLELPPDWSRQGVYTLRRDEGLIFVHSKLASGEKELSQHVLASIDVGAVHARSNYSEKSAIIVDSSGILRVQAILLFPKEFSAPLAKVVVKSEMEPVADATAEPSLPRPPPTALATNVTPAKVQIAISTDLAPPPVPEELQALIARVRPGISTMGEVLEGDGATLGDSVPTAPSEATDTTVANAVDADGGGHTPTPRPKGKAKATAHGEGTAHTATGAEKKASLRAKKEK